jgi:hypothetical protein
MATVEAVMEERIARLESNVEHIQGDIGEIKVDLRALRDKMDTMYTGLSGRIDNLGTTLDGKISALDQKMDHKVSQLDDKLSTRISSLEEKMDDRFTAFEEKMDGRFIAFEEKMDGRFATADERADGRFSALDGIHPALGAAPLRRPGRDAARDDGARIRLDIAGAGVTALCRRHIDDLPVKGTSA